MDSGVRKRRTAHFSAGIGISSCLGRLITVGSDQRVCLFRIPDLEILQCFYTDVQDPHRLVVRRSEEEWVKCEEEVLIVGRGLQLFKISDNPGSELLP